MRLISVSRYETGKNQVHECVRTRAHIVGDLFLKVEKV